jgi:hypothetical protein
MLMSDGGAKPMKIYYTVLTRRGYSHDGLLEDPDEAEKRRAAFDDIYRGCSPHTVIALVPKAEAEAAIAAARAKVPMEIAVVVRAVPAIANLWCDPGASKRLLDALEWLTPAQRKACGLKEK